ncbi:MAG TPA: VWA domain-containing protein [Candidatus Sulfotelmatobacter sp.]|nr:VWA domain-containing protein [Candidatus Sulfotelmatobacter sp.]
MNRSSWGRRVGRCASVLFAVLPLSIAQDRTVPTLTFRTSSHLVLLDAVITDKNGNPVPRLTAKDFELKEDGKVQKLAFVTPPGERENQAVPPTLPAGVYSNSPRYRLSGPAPIAIILDSANTTFKDQLYARTEMLKYLKAQHSPEQRIAIFALTDKLSLVQDFTGDAATLQAALENLNLTVPELSRTASGGEAQLRDLRVNAQQYQALVQAFGKFQRSQSQYSIARRVEVTLDAMRRITRMLGGLPGRKNIIWISGGLPFTLDPDVAYNGTELAENFQTPMRVTSRFGAQETLTSSQSSFYGEKIREIASQMAYAQVAIYPIDARGLLISTSQTDVDVQETMREIARQTGGRAFVSRNEIDNGIALTQRDRTATYTLGYYPANKKLDHKFRTIDVKVDHPGVETTYRRGYFAVEDTHPSDEKLDQELAQAWQDEAPDTLVAFEAQLSAAGSGKTRVDFLVDANSLSTAGDAGGKKFDIGFYIAALCPKGKVLLEKGTKLQRAFPTDVYNQMLQKGIHIHLETDTPPSCQELGLAVRDNRTAYIGTLRAPLPAKP